MSRAILNVPRSLLREMNCDWDIEWRNQSTGAANDGNSQIVMTRFPRWIGSPTIVLERSFIGQWRAIRARARGRGMLYRVAMCDTGVANPLANFSRGIPHSTAQVFSTGQGYLYQPKAYSFDGALAGDTSITVTENPDHPFVVGQFLSYDDWPFLVTSVSGSGSEKTLEVEMPLRADIPAGGGIDLIATGLFEATEDQMGNPSYNANFVSRPQLSFQEFLNR